VRTSGALRCGNLASCDNANTGQALQETEAGTSVRCFGLPICSPDAPPVEQIRPGVPTTSVRFQAIV